MGRIGTAKPRKPSPRKTALSPLAGQPPVPAGLSPSALKPAKPAFTFSPYPDLSMAISMLEKRLQTVGSQRQPLLSKWIASLKKIQNEMTQLRKLERLTENLAARTQLPL